jgi:hypothetical protein
MFTLAGLLLLGFALITLVGCDDEDETVMQSGDPNDPGFQFVQDEVGSDAFDNFGVDLNLSMALLESTLGGGSQSDTRNSALRKAVSALNGNAEIIISGSSNFEFTQDGWYVFDFEALVVEDLTDSLEIVGIDSVQILLDDVPVQWADPQPEIDELKAYAHVNWMNNSDDSAGAHHRMQVLVEMVNSDSVVTVNAGIDDTLHTDWANDTESCELLIDRHIDLTDFVVLVGPNEADDCPQSGSAVVAAGIDLDCTGSGGLREWGVEGAWSITAVVNGDGTVTVTASIGNTTWTVTEPIEGCQAGGTS